MRIRGLGRLQMILRATQERLSPIGIILLYHRIAERTADPQALCTSPRIFREQMEQLKQLTDPVPLDKLFIELQKRSRTSKPVSVVTFDDGYADNLLNAVPLLEAAEIPATIFVTTGGLGTQNEFYWDALERLFLRSSLPSTFTFEMEDQTYNWTFPASAPKDATWNVRKPFNNTRQQAYVELCTHFSRLKPDQRAFYQTQLGEQLKNHDAPLAENRIMTEQELITLRNHPLISIGVHTVRHPILSTLTAAEQKDEIYPARDHIRALLDHPPLLFSYPYGRRSDYNKASLRLIKEAGFSTSCSNFPGRATRWTPPLQLPRVIPGNLDAAAFKGWVIQQTGT